jgi:hypothetical protein
LLQKNFVIYTLDCGYGKKLLELALCQKEIELNYYLFHELEELESFAKSHKISYLIQGSEIPIEVREKIEGERKFLLIEEPLEEGESFEIAIYKYQRGENILNKIYLEEVLKEEEVKGAMLFSKEAESGEVGEIGILRPLDRSSQTLKEGLSSSYDADYGYGKKEEGKSRGKASLIREKRGMRYGGSEESAKRNREGKIIGIYSPIHRIGKTKFAINLGKEMARDEPVLYINLEPFGRGGYFPEGEEGDLGNLLYFGSQEHQNLGLRLSVMVEQMDKLDYIKPMAFVEDLYRVEGSAWREVLTKILEESIYTTVILDITDGIKDLFGILEFCDTVYTLYIEESIAMGKLKEYTDNLVKTGYDSVLEHTIQKKVELM